MGNQVHVDIFYRGNDLSKTPDQQMMDVANGRDAERRKFQTELQAKFNTVSGTLTKHGVVFLPNLNDMNRSISGKIDEDNIAPLNADLASDNFVAQFYDPDDMSDFDNMLG